MRRPRTLGVGWLLMLITTLLLCISGLHWAHVTTMNTSIDHIIEETFDTVMHDLAQSLTSPPQALNTAQCDQRSQHMLERTHAQLEPVLRVSVARGGRIWCDSDTSTVGTSVPDSWPKAPASGHKPQVFKTEQLTGAVLALSPAQDALSLWVFVTPFKDYDKGLNTVWGLGWPYLISILGLVAVICACTLWLLRHLQSLFNPECDALDRLKTSPPSSANTSGDEHDLADWAAQELQRLAREQDHITSRMERV